MLLRGMASTSHPADAAPQGAHDSRGVVAPSLRGSAAVIWFFIDLLCLWFRSWTINKVGAPSRGLLIYALLDLRRK